MSANDLRVSLLQADTRWHDPLANRQYYDEVIAPLRGTTDLIVLPETFTSGFSNEVLDQAETMDGDSVKWMQKQSQLADSAICGSVQIRDDEKVFNRFLWVQPDGVVLHYDKRHLFRMANEHRRYAAGAEKLIVQWRGWRICPQVCYDLRFPVFSRNRFNHSVTEALDYDMLIYVANWPAARRNAWNILLRARAMENLAAVVAVNRVGIDGNGVEYAGDSVALNWLGESLAEAGSASQVLSAVFSKSALLDYRAKFPAYLDADAFKLILE